MTAEWSTERSQEQVCGPDREQAVEDGAKRLFPQFSVKIHLFLAWSKSARFSACEFSARPKVCRQLREEKLTFQTIWSCTEFLEGV